MLGPQTKNNFVISFIKNLHQQHDNHIKATLQSKIVKRFDKDLFQQALESMVFGGVVDKNWPLMIEELLSLDILSRSELLLFLGISDRTLMRIIDGQTSRPSMTTRCRLYLLYTLFMA